MFSLIPDLQLTVVNDVRMLVEALADTVSAELLVHAESVPLRKIPSCQLRRTSKAHSMVLPITLKRSPGRHARMARSSASSVAATSSRPGLSVLGRRKVAEVSPWKPSR